MSSSYNLLIAACKGDKNKMCEALRDGADANMQNMNGKTALMLAAEYGREHGAGMMRLLLDAGANANKQEDDGWTALMFAAQEGGEHAVGMMRVLIDAGADPNKQEDDGWTALMYAAQEGGRHGAEMMRVLLDAGADANKQEQDGSTALMTAAYGGEHAAGMMRLLVDSGADANKQADANEQDEEGSTALMIAARYGGKYSDKIIYVLVNAGADITIKDINNKTAYDIAVEKNNTLAICILQEYQANWTFTWTAKNPIQLKLWSEQNIQSVRNIHTSWSRDKQSGFGKLPWVIIRDIILPMTIDRKDTVKLIKKKKEEEKNSSRPCKRARIH